MASQSRSLDAAKQAFRQSLAPEPASKVVQAALARLETPGASAPERDPAVTRAATN